MIYKHLQTCILLMVFCLNTSAQQYMASTACSEQRQLTPSYTNWAKTTAAIPEVEYYDVKNLKFDISLTNTTTYVAGVVTTSAEVTALTMSVYAFELNNSLVIDSVKINNTIAAVASTGNVRKVTMPTTLSKGATFDADVYYHGSTTPGNGQFFTGGLNPVTTTNGFKLMYSLSDKDLAMDWWPCKQTLQDKIDAVQMFVTVDDTLTVGSNGILQRIIPWPLIRKQTFQWETQYPIDYYLISVAVAPYNEYSYYMHFTDGSNDSMLIQNYVYNTPGHFTTAAKAAIDSTGMIVDYFSKLFGRYPFFLEKYGHCMSPLSGGMEHQTMTTMGLGAYSDVTLIAHELGHQWWGNNVTYGSWQDIWLSEGITSYCEQLFVEHFRGDVAFKNYRTQVFNGSFSSGGTVYVDDTTSVNRIFNNTLTYNKGASVTHMLRYIAPQDSLFFVGLRAYQQAYKNGCALTSDLKNTFELAYNTDLDTFFAHWIYGAGYPTYSAKWYQEGQRVAVQIKQTTSSPASVACFKMPLEIKLKTTAGDRVVKVDNNINSYTYIMGCDSIVTGIEIDPNNHILNGTGPIVKDESVMRVDEFAKNIINVYPNPATDEWRLQNIPANVQLLLKDVTGKVLWEDHDCKATTTIPAKNLVIGNYILSVTVGNSSTEYIRLIKY